MAQMSSDVADVLTLEDRSAHVLQFQWVADTIPSY